MRAFEIKLGRLVRYKTKRACCSVVKDEWFRIVTGFVISIMRIKPVKFRGYTVGTRELLDVIWSRKTWTSTSDFCIWSFFFASLGTPFHHLLEWFNIFKTQKSALGARCDICRKRGYPKSETAWVRNFSLGEISKRWGGPSSFYGRKVGYQCHQEIPGIGSGSVL